MLSIFEKNNLPYGILTGFNSNNKVRRISKNSIFNYHVNSNNYGVVECVHQNFFTWNYLKKKMAS